MSTFYRTQHDALDKVFLKKRVQAQDWNSGYNNCTVLYKFCRQIKLRIWLPMFSLVLFIMLPSQTPFTIGFLLRRCAKTN